MSNKQTPQTAAQRKAKGRKLKKDAGYVQMPESMTWVKSEWIKPISDFIDNLKGEEK